MPILLLQKGLLRLPKLAYTLDRLKVIVYPVKNALSKIATVVFGVAALQLFLA